MPRKKGKFAIVYSFIDLLVEHPSRILEFLLALVLGYFAVGSVAHFAGILSYGGWLPVFLSGLIPASLVFLGIVWLRKETLPVFWQMWLPLPFLLWACFSLWSGRGSPWMGAQQLSYYWALYLVFIFAVAGMRNRASWYLVFWMIQIGWLWAITTTFLQFYFRNDWLPLAALETGVVWDGRASGVIGDPNLFAVGMLFMFVGNLYLVLIQRFSGYLRLFCGFLAAIALMGVVVSGDRTTLWILLGLAAVVPFITVQPWKLKFKRLFWVMLALLGFTGLLWLTADLYTVKPRLAELWRGAPLPERAVSESIGWNMLNQSPVSGQGIGALVDYGEAFREEMSTTRREWRAAPSYIKIGSELGFVGLTLATLPMLILWIHGWLSWRRTPYSRTDRDAQFRTKPLKEEVSKDVEDSAADALATNTEGSSRKRRRRRKRQRPKFTLPLTGEKIIRGAGWVSLSVALLTFWRFPLLSIPWLMTPLLFACAFLVRFSFEPLSVSSKSLLSRLSWSFAVLFTLIFLLVSGRPQARMQADLHEAQFLFAAANQLRTANPDVEPLAQTVHLLDGVLQRSPDHALALAFLVRAQVAEYRLDGIVTEIELGTTLELAKRATARDPRLWQAWLALGEAHSFRTLAFSSDADEAFAKALQLAPNRREVLLAYARFLERAPLRRNQALELVQRVLAVEPGDAEAERLRGRLGLR